MPKSRSIQASKTPETGLPVLWYYFVTVLVVACLVILFAVVALSNYRDVILNASARQARTNLEAASRMAADTSSDAARDARLLGDYLVAQLRATPAADTQTPAYWERTLLEGATLILRDYTAPANAFVVLDPAAGGFYAGAEAGPATAAVSGAPPGSATPAPWASRSTAGQDFWKASFFRDLAREVMARRQAQQSSLHLDPEGKFALITTLVPLMREDQVIGVVGVSTDVERLVLAMESWRVGDRGGLVLLDNASSTVLTRPVQGVQISGFLNAPERFTYNLSRDTRHNIAAPVFASRISPTKVTGDDGQGYFTLVQPVGYPAWTVIAYVPEEEIIAEFADRSRNLLLLSIGLLVTVVGAIVLLNRSLSLPLARLLGAVGKPIARVDEENIRRLRAPEEGPREIAGIAAAYNRLLDTVVEEMHSKNEYAKRLEASHEHLSGFSKMLEKMVGDRTRELERSKETAEAARENAERAQRFAEEANEAKSNFLANISHELRTPMNAILGYTELLMEEAEENNAPDTLPDLHKVHTAGKHLLTLIDDILDIAKIESGHMNLKFETFHVGEMLQEVIEATEPLTRNQLNRLYFRSQVGEVQMMADRTKVKQILLNLASNACKFTDHGEIHFEAVCTVEGGRPSLVCEVRDTGIGMSENQLARIFEKFSQVDESATRRHGGSGLGLFICRNFSEIMGGSITVISEPGFGSTFTLELPLDVPAAISDRNKAVIHEMERAIKEKSMPIEELAT